MIISGTYPSSCTQKGLLLRRCVQNAISGACLSKIDTIRHLCVTKYVYARDTQLSYLASAIFGIHHKTSHKRYVGTRLECVDLSNHKLVLEASSFNISASKSPQAFRSHVVQLQEASNTWDVCRNCGSVINERAKHL